MPAIPKKLSVKISLAFSAVFFAALAAACFMFPVFVRHLYAAEAVVSLPERWIILVLGYSALLAAAVADVLLALLLKRVDKGLVFTGMTAALVRRVSWCCFFVGLVFAALGFIYLLSWAVCLAAVLLGFCLRVVKNVIEEAIEIKSENDLTV